MWSTQDLLLTTTTVAGLLLTCQSCEALAGAVRKCKSLYIKGVKKGLWYQSSLGRTKGATVYDYSTGTERVLLGKVYK